MKLHLFLAIASLLILQTACSKCPKDEKLGDVKLTSESLENVPYSGGEALVFKNEAGEELLFNVPNNAGKQDDRIVVDVPCSEGSYLRPDYQEIYYEQEKYSLYLTSDDMQTNTLLFNLFILTVDDLPGNDTLWVDYMEATAQFGTHVANHYRVTSERGNPAIDMDRVEELNNSLFVGAFDLLDKSFQDVYRNADIAADSTFVYFNKIEGIVGITTPDEDWVLDRIE